MTDVVFRDLHGMDEMLAAEDLQWAVWGKDDKADPGDLMLVIQHEGGLVGGAFVDGRLMGYVFGFPTREDGIQHSHRLAVHPDARGLGLGLRLKWYQRDWCLARGINHVRWTYDPLRVPNAALNINRLGAVASTYLADYYGAMKGINAGAPSDRLMADWFLDSPRVAARAEGRDAPDEGDPEMWVALPEDFGAMLTAAPEAANEARLSNRAALTAAFERGLVIRSFDAAKRQYGLFRQNA